MTDNQDADRPRAVAARLRIGDVDANGETVVKVFVSTEQFVIYLAQGSGRIRSILPDDYEAAKQLRANLAPVAGSIASVGDVLADVRNTGLLRTLWSPEFESLRERMQEQIAKAMQMAYEGQAASAAALLEQAREEVIGRRDSLNRMRYILANVVAINVILGLLVADWSRVFPKLDHLLQATLAAGETTLVGGFQVLDVLALGALGAFFSVSADLRSIQVNHSISFGEMMYAGFVRIPIGVIAAGVVVFLIEGGWILGSVDPKFQVWSLYLFGFLGGFSEYFVANALKQAEKTASKP